MRRTPLLLACLAAAGAALKVQPTAFTRRSAFLLILPAAALPAHADEAFQYKEGRGKTSKAAACPEGQRLAPDGFGGKVCKGKVKQLKDQVADAVVDALSSDGTPAASSAPAAPASAAKPKAAAPPPPPPPPPEKPLTFEELVANSIKSKETLLGRELSAAEKAEMEAKVKKLLK